MIYNNLTLTLNIPSLLPLSNPSSTLAYVPRSTLYYAFAFIIVYLRLYYSESKGYI